MRISKLFNWIVNPLSDSQKPTKPPLPAQDPMDWRPSETATKWGFEQHFCPQCNWSISNSEWYAKCCYHCGYKVDRYMEFRSRNFRQIWDGEKWVWQYKWGNKESQYMISPKRLHF